ncbi:MAG: valine--tRNA ligase, partial [Candidatus Omnitrophota bacterium]
QTALSDEESVHIEMDGNLYYFKYPFKDHPEKFIQVATTRPETMLGDSAVAVNPKDERYKPYIGKTLILPLANREIKIIADNLVDMQFGTGAVKVTPAHDPNDYRMGKKHNLEFINVMTPDGRMNSAAGKFSGMDRFKAREAVVESLKEAGLLEKIQEHKLSIGHCYRCKTIVEPYLSKQWFVKMKPLARPAIKAVKNGKIKFYPQRWTKVYLSWMENIQDWCISRQIWWGHRIPVYYCANCRSRGKEGIIVSKSKPGKCPKCASSEITQEQDVLDTWFSSWLWPFATFYWPKETRDLKYFYPTDALATAPEIIFFWVARMIMAGLEFRKQIPFKDVYLHGTVRDTDGKKMSKSLGNVIDPLKVIAEYGADALRFSIISITAQGQDVYLSKDRFEQGRNFANKLWNASRFVLMNLEEEKAKADLCVFFKNEKLDTVNRWILSRFYSTLKKTEEDLCAYRFNEAANGLYSFFWHEYCDWYLELIKPGIKNKDTQLVMYKVLEKYLRLIHPFMPFISEEIWQKLPGAEGLIANRQWPHMQPQIISEEDERRMQTAFDIINAVRNMRVETEIPPNSLIEIKIASSAQTNKEILPLAEYIKIMSKARNLRLDEGYSPQKNEFARTLNDMHIIIPLSGMVNAEEQIKKTQVKIDRLSGEIKNKEAMLSNANFTSRAPAEVVEAEKEKVKSMREQILKLEEIKNGLR